MSKRFTFISLALAASVAFLVGIIVAGGVSQTPVLSTAPVHEVANDRPRPASFSGVVNFAYGELVTITGVVPVMTGRFQPVAPRPLEEMRMAFVKPPAEHSIRQAVRLGHNRPAKLGATACPSRP